MSDDKYITGFAATPELARQYVRDGRIGYPDFDECRAALVALESAFADGKFIWLGELSNDEPALVKSAGAGLILWKDGEAAPPFRAPLAVGYTAAVVGGAVANESGIIVIVEDAERLVLALVTFIDHFSYGRTGAIEQVSDYTNEKDVSIILKNNEHHIKVRRSFMLRIVGHLVSLFARTANAFEPVADAKLNKARRRSGKAPIALYYKLTAPDNYTTQVDVEAAHPAHAPYQGGTHASPIPHTRRGHYRTYASGTRAWVRDTMVNAKAGTPTRSHYVVKSEAASNAE